MGRMLVFHGSFTEIRKPRIVTGRNTKDFGAGFYCTVIREQAERWARRFDTPKLNIYSCLIDEELDILEFQTMTDEWLDFIIACRNGEKHNHDIVIGAICGTDILGDWENL